MERIIRAAAVKYWN